MMLSLASRRTLHLAPTLLRANYSSATAGGLGGVKISTTSTGVKVATYDEASPVAALAVVANAGSRAETPGSEGVAHFLKNWGFQNNERRTAFRITRETEILGGILSSTLGRETLVYSAEFLAGDAEYFAEIMGDVVSATKFQEHELEAIAERVGIESAYARSNSVITALDAAHEVAFRSGLGNSLFARPTSRVNAQVVKKFASKVFQSGNIALVGLGVPHEDLVGYVSSYFNNVPSGSTPSEPSKYYGGEGRIPAETAEGTFLLAYPAPSALSSDYATAEVFRHVLGGDRHVKWSKGVSPLSNAADKIGGVQLSSFNLAYSDNGLFGITVSGDAAHVRQGAAAAAELLKSITNGVDNEDLKRAVAQAKFAAASGVETRADRLQILGSAALTYGKYVTPSELAAQFDKVEASDVVNIAKKAFSSKPTFVAVGDVRALPYADSLSL